MCKKHFLNQVLLLTLKNTYKNSIIFTKVLNTIELLSSFSKEFTLPKNNSIKSPYFNKQSGQSPELILAAHWKYELLIGDQLDILVVKDPVWSADQLPKLQYVVVQVPPQTCRLDAGRLTGGHQRAPGNVVRVVLGADEGLSLGNEEGAALAAEQVQFDVFQ